MGRPQVFLVLDKLIDIEIFEIVNAHSVVSRPTESKNWEQSKIVNLARRILPQKTMKTRLKSCPRQNPDCDTSSFKVKNPVATSAA